MSRRRRVWESSPGRAGVRHRLTITQDGRRVVRILSWPDQPDQPDREPREQVHECVSEHMADALFGAWSRVVPRGYRLVESTEDEDRVEAP